MRSSWLSDIIIVENDKLRVDFSSVSGRVKSIVYSILILLILFSLCFLFASISLNLFTTGDFMSFMKVSPTNIVLVLSVFIGGFIAHQSLFGVLEKAPFRFIVFKVFDFEDLRRKNRYIDKQLILLLITSTLILGIILTVYKFDLNSTTAILNLDVLGFLFISFLIIVFIESVSIFVWLFVFSIYISFASINNLEILFDRTSGEVSYTVNVYGRLLERKFYAEERLGYPFLKFIAIVFDSYTPSIRFVLQYHDYMEFLYVARAQLNEIKRFLKKITNFYAVPVKKIFFTKPISIFDEKI